MSSSSKGILVIGAGGQVGVELVNALRGEYGREKVVAADIRHSDTLAQAGPFIILDALDSTALRQAIETHHIGTVYMMAAMLSATGEKQPMKAWHLNMESLLIVLELAREQVIDKIFWPSSIAVFGPSSPKLRTPQRCVMEPSTVYGISKVSGEMWCQYYHDKHGVDVRSIRYPGLIGSKSAPGGGTTDYAVHIFHEALATGRYECFLSADRSLPMMHMDDAIRATIELMNAESSRLSIRTSYNISGLSFSPRQLAEEIRTHLGTFEMSYRVDFRDELAASWPESIDDSVAEADWGWHSSYDISRLTKSMLEDLRIADST